MRLLFCQSKFKNYAAKTVNQASGPPSRNVFTRQLPALQRRSSSPLRLRAFALCLLSLTGVVFASAKKPTPQDSTEREKELGKEGAKEVESKLKIVDDKAVLAKLAEMCKAIGAASERPLIQYQVKIVDPKVPNAFTLPGGYVYVTKGLLDYTQSDHELAGVLAHEIAHNARFHAMKALAKEKKLQLAQLLALGVGIASGSTSGLNVAVFAQYLTLAIINGFGVEAEAEADQAAIQYLSKTSYNPVGLLTFLERLARDENRRPQGPDPGIFRTHPPTPERIEAAEKEILSLGLPLNRAAVTTVPQAVVEAAPDARLPSVQVKVGKQVLCQLTDGEGKSAQERAEKLIAVFNEVVGQGLRVYEVQIRDGNSRPSLFVRSRLLVDVLSSDADLAGVNQSDLAALWEGNFRKIIWGERINDSY